MINKNSKILVTGHKGLVGSAVIRRLKFFGFNNIVTIDKKKLDLKKQKNVFDFFKKKKFDGVINAAAVVGGILVNSRLKAKFIYDNITIQNNVIHGCYLSNTKNLIFLGSSCIYPKFCKQPIREKYLLTGELEKTNEPYAIAKIAGIKMCESYNFQYNLNFKCLMPCNLYGVNDNYDLKSSHFFPALIRKIYQAKKNNKKLIKVWGTGQPKRELMYVDDLADACIFFLKKKTTHSLINIGSGKEKKIIDYVKFLKEKMNFKGNIILDKSKPDGTPRKIIDSSIAKRYGWRPKINLSDGFNITFNDFMSKIEKN
jgi:GDP-L-fucose synthase